MELKVYTQDGQDSGRVVSLDETVFGITPNDHAIWLDVRSIQAAARQGTHKAKERSEVARSTRKLYRQKGTGGARSGDYKSPLKRGGGTIFGPRPHKYVVSVNRKTKQVARRSALSYKAVNEGLVVIENFAMDAPKTKAFAGMLNALQVAGKKVLFLTGQHDEVIYKSGRNLAKVHVKEAANASTLDLVNAQVVLMQESALEELTALLTKQAN